MAGPGIRAAGPASTAPKGPGMAGRAFGSIAPPAGTPPQLDLLADEP